MPDQNCLCDFRGNMRVPVVARLGNVACSSPLRSGLVMLFVLLSLNLLNSGDLSSGARGAPWVRKFGNPLIRTILVLTSAYLRPSVRTDSGGGCRESQDSLTGGGGMPFFLVAEVNNMAACSSYASFSIR